MHDILTYPKDRDKHITYLNTALKTMGEHQLYSNSKKCEFWFEKLVFLRHAVTKDGMKVNPKAENNFRVAKAN